MPMQRRHERSWETGSPEETIALGVALGQALESGLMIGLVGPLGAGKTQLVKGIAAGNAEGQAVEVTSPTFSLVHEYPGRVLLVHVDSYRLEHPAAELCAIGFDEWMESEAAVVVEWADRIRPIMPEATVWIKIDPTGAGTRMVLLEGVGGCAASFLRRLDSPGR